MQRMSHRIVAALAAVAGWAGLVSAQYAVPNAYPVIPIAPIQYQAQATQPAPQTLLNRSQPAPGAIVPQQGVPPQLQGAPPQLPPAGAPVVGGAPYTYPGCYNCAPNATAGAQFNQTPQRVACGAGSAPVPYNEYCTQCANGCGSIKSDLGFIFGSCKNFFNPCGPKPFGAGSGCGNGACGNGGCSHCGAFPLGKPYGKCYNGCVYDSYLNH